MNAECGINTAFCSKCSQSKEKSCFNKRADSKNGLQKWCRDCQKLQEKQSRQRRLEQKRIYQPIWRSKNRAKVVAYFNKAKQKDPQKVWCRVETRKAIASGILVKQGCSICGETKVEAHHTDYSNPLDIVWLCKKHHTETHKNENRN